MEDEKIIHEPKFFSVDELRLLKDLESQQINKVLFHYWVNAAKLDDIIQLLNYIEFQFIDNTNLIIAASELCDSIEVVTIDIEAEKKSLLEKFKGNITLQTTDKTKDPLWSRMIGYPVAEILLDKNLSNQFYSDKMIIDFLPLRILISIIPLGLQYTEITDHLN
ncbi:MAG: hypothetical protein ABI723_08205 [Bacteroidia bacterium]